ncbi:hypothetical protein E0E54_19600 [Azotobacter chroococcum]|uniref:hypothetical protein n=1 Tax=Azotobacter chroococcum TaxID=353 RepID=UPI00103FB138|nr:hypothetical protein [Azotobacter chroococcum]TBW32292.1 hypothetical protein E0E54_19600 [Azotobacter chroococcum]
MSFQKIAVKVFGKAAKKIAKNAFKDLMKNDSGEQASDYQPPIPSTEDGSPLKRKTFEQFVGQKKCE